MKPHTSPTGLALLGLFAIVLIYGTLPHNEGSNSPVNRPPGYANRSNACLSDKDTLIVDALKLFNFIQAEQDVCVLKDDSIPQIYWPWHSVSNGTFLPSRSRTGIPKYCESRQQMSFEAGRVIPPQVNITQTVTQFGCRQHLSENNNFQKPAAALCAIIRNDAPQLTEWLLHHLLIGVEHIYVFDDCSTDNLREVIAPFISEGFATLLYLNEDHTKHNQKFAYQFCQNRYSNLYDYIAYLDGDEYLTPIKHRCVSSILEHMDKFKAGGISLHTVEFGHENDVVATHHCKIRTGITGTHCTGFGQMAKALCHTRRSSGANSPHCCITDHTHPVMYALDQPKAIDQGNDPEMCFSISEDVRGRWNDSWAFVQHRPRMSLFDYIMKKKREKYGVFHDSLMYKGHLSIFELYTAFVKRGNRCDWQHMTAPGVSVRENLIRAIHEAMLHFNYPGMPLRCKELKRRTDAFHKLLAES